jgi:hypothetical protein
MVPPLTVSAPGRRRALGLSCPTARSPSRFAAPGVGLVMSYCTLSLGFVGPARKRSLLAVFLVLFRWCGCIPVGAPADCRAFSAW